MFRHKAPQQLCLLHTLGKRSQRLAHGRLAPWLLLQTRNSAIYICIYIYAFRDARSSIHYLNPNEIFSPNNFFISVDFKGIYIYVTNSLARIYRRCACIINHIYSRVPVGCRHFVQQTIECYYYTFLGVRTSISNLQSVL